MSHKPLRAAGESDKRHYAAIAEKYSYGESLQREVEFLREEVKRLRAELDVVRPVRRNPMKVIGPEWGPTIVDPVIPLPYEVTYWDAGISVWPRTEQ